MPVLFVVLALAVLAAVAVVAAGRGDPLADAPPDRAPFDLPDRPLAPADVDGVRFSLGFRGYRMDQVDSVLDRVGLELAARDARVAELEAALAVALEPPPPAADAVDNHERWEI